MNIDIEKIIDVVINLKAPNGRMDTIDYKDNKTTFNINLVKSKLFITEKLF